MVKRVPSVEIFMHWLREGWWYRLPDNPDMEDRESEYGERVKYEASQVIEKDMVDYFLVTSDIVRWAKDHNIAVGPARGSAASSLVCYLLRITEVNPMHFPTMLFERFIDPGRTDLADIDLDFDDERRHEVFEYAARTYGSDRVANIGNITRYLGKNSINDVAKVYRIPSSAAQAIKGVIIERSGGDSRFDQSLADTIEMFDPAREAVKQYPDLMRAVDLEGNIRGFSVHAAGLVISNTPIADTCAMYTREKDGARRTVLAYDKKHAEYLGMLKIDCLGLSTMGMIGIVLDMIDMDLADLYRIPIDDEPTIKAFRDGDVVGIFQFEGRATRVVCRNVQPETFMHLADINALSRPGPLFSGMTQMYADVRHGRMKADKLHPIVWKYTEHTYGQIVYQEQVLSIIRELGGFPVAAIGDIRRIISQKLGEAQFQGMYEQFVSGCQELHGVERELATRIWRFMVTSATYSFNQSHSVSYSLLAYWCMWLKQNHPAEFYAAQLRKVGDDKIAREFRRPRLLNDAVKKGYEILPPNPKVSEYSWMPEPDGLRAGFVQIPGVGPTTATNIIRYRDTFGLENWTDLEAVKGIGPTTIEKVNDFAEAEDPFDIELTTRTLGTIRDSIRLRKPGFRGLPRPTHTSDTIPRDVPQGEHRVVTWLGVVRRIEHKDLIEDQIARTGKTPDEVREGLKDPHLVKFCTLHCYDDGDEEVYLRFNRWQFPKFEEMISQIIPGQDVVIAIGKKRQGFGVSVAVDTMHHGMMGDEEEDGTDENGI